MDIKQFRQIFGSRPCYHFYVESFNGLYVEVDLNTLQQFLDNCELCDKPFKFTSKPNPLCPEFTSIFVHKIF